MTAYVRTFVPCMASPGRGLREHPTPNPAVSAVAPPTSPIPWTQGELLFNLEMLVERYLTQYYAAPHWSRQLTPAKSLLIFPSPGRKSFGSRTNLWQKASKNKEMSGPKSSQILVVALCWQLEGMSAKE